jgi:hypothetical protein
VYSIPLPFRTLHHRRRDQTQQDTQSTSEAHTAIRRQYGGTYYSHEISRVWGFESVVCEVIGYVAEEEPLSNSSASSVRHCV